MNTLAIKVTLVALGAGVLSVDSTCALGAGVHDATVPEGRVAVEYANGQMRVQTGNASLAEVLREVCRVLGAHLEGQVDAVPTGGVIGPASPRDVVQSLLRGSGLNYALSVSSTDPAIPGRITVFPSSSAPHATPVAPVASVTETVQAPAPRNAQSQVASLIPPAIEVTRGESEEPPPPPGPTPTELAQLAKLRSVMDEATAASSSGDVTPRQLDSGHRTRHGGRAH